MHRPTDSQLLELWERAYGRTPCEQALILLAACESDLSPAQLLECSVGHRNRRLLRLREQLFGQAAEMVADCPQCQTTLEVGIHVSEMLEATPTDSPSPRNELTVDGYRLSYRLPNSGDLIALAADPAEQRRQSLITRCVECVDRDGVLANLEQLPATAIEQLATAMAETDPLADIHFDLQCETCQHRFSAAFDVMAFVWNELNLWAQRVLLQVHTLARSYGWTQREILRLSNWRRQVYLNMARQ